MHFSTVWKSPQPVDSPIEAIYDATTEHPNSITTNPGANKGKNVIGSKYFDSEGNRIKIENIVKKPAKKEGAEEKPNDMEDVEADSTAKEDTQEESKADEIEDPVWHSVRTGGSTRADMEGYNYVPDQETEDLIKQLKRAQGGEAPTNGYVNDFFSFCMILTSFQKCREQRRRYGYFKFW